MSTERAFTSSCATSFAMTTLDEWPLIAKIIGGGSSIVGIAGTWLALRRRFSRDEVELAHDKSARSSISRRDEELEEAHERSRQHQKDAQLAWDERNKLVGELATMKAENGYLRETMIEMRATMAMMKRRLDALEHKAKIST